MKKLNSIAFTGYRPAKLPFSCTRENIFKLKALISRSVCELSEGGVRHFMTGMCPGIDLWAAQVVLELRAERGLQLWCAVPFDTHRDTIPSSELSAYDEVLRLADGAVVLARGVTSSGYGRSYNGRNRYMVNRCDGLIAVCDPGCIIPGGTRNTVMMARAAGKPIFYVNPNDII